jgi:hypothetical protein
MCDFILKTGEERKDCLLYRKMINRSNPLEGQRLKEYIAKKRSTAGTYSSWSDSFTFEAMAAYLDRPVLQVIYPVYIDGDKRADLPPRFYRSYCGSEEVLPIQIHYNGINHYNTFAPKNLPDKPKGANTVEELFANFDECDFEGRSLSASSSRSSV